VFPADANVSEESLLTDEAIHARFQKFFPNETPYDIVHRNLYTVHQRVASTFRKGRILLAGDSAHVNNSIGGMGLNGGLQDAANLAEKLVQVLNGAPDHLMDLYSLQRRTVSIEYVQAQSIANKKQLETREPEERKKVLADLAETAADPVKARAYLLRTSMIALQQRAAAINLEEAA
jgi:3-(3-hydroxy-phenyl)propionate hydroxylase